MLMSQLFSRRNCLFAIAATLASAFPALGQEQPNIRTVTRYRLKPDRVGEFRSVIKEINGVFKKSGHNRALTWWRAQSGPREFASVAYYAKWADLGLTPVYMKESAAAMAPLLARLNQCSDSVERTIDEVMPDHGLPMASEAPAFVRVTRIVVKPERVEEYLQLRKNEFLPAVKKTGATIAVFTRTRFGGPTNEFRSAIGMKGWGDLDGPPPIIEAMGGEAAYQKYVAKLRSMINELEYNLYAFEADLSYIPAR